MQLMRHAQYPNLSNDEKAAFLHVLAKDFGTSPEIDIDIQVLKAHDLHSLAVLKFCTLHRESMIPSGLPQFIASVKN